MEEKRMYLKWQAGSYLYFIYRRACMAGVLNIKEEKNIFLHRIALLRQNGVMMNKSEYLD